MTQMCDWTGFMSSWARTWVAAIKEENWLSRVAGRQWWKGSSSKCVSSSEELEWNKYLDSQDPCLEKLHSLWMCKFSRDHTWKVLGKSGGMASWGSGLRELQRSRGGPVHLLKVDGPKTGKTPLLNERKQAGGKGAHGWR